MQWNKWRSCLTKHQSDYNQGPEWMSVLTVLYVHLFVCVVGDLTVARKDGVCVQLSTVCDPNLVRIVEVQDLTH